ncbi:hypothetical protein ACM614_12690 [Streptomyces sp. 12297]|uniref:hypothetical protein n=1 Tax=Streptomyces sp. NBC_00239 TaxID=2903640 RepID=UPI002E2A4FD0|nr:hypothetical protein [Streptomyces sp. NBC_00239]
MAVADGTGGFGLGGGFGLIPLAGPAGAVSTQAQALAVEAESMTKYKQRVDELLDRLEGSQAAPAKLADGTLPSGDLGSGFGEADILSAAYDTVHTELKSLSKALAVQIEALSIAVESSRVGYQNMDDEVKERMRRLHADAEKRYDPQRDPYEREKAADGGSHQPAQTPAPDHGSTSGGSF